MWFALLVQLKTYNWWQGIRNGNSVYRVNVNFFTTLKNLLLRKLFSRALCSVHFKSKDLIGICWGFFQKLLRLIVHYSKVVEVNDQIVIAKLEKTKMNVKECSTGLRLLNVSSAKSNASKALLFGQLSAVLKLIFYSNLWCAEWFIVLVNGNN